MTAHTLIMNGNRWAIIELNGYFDLWSNGHFYGQFKSLKEAIGYAF